jgi:hypothetical protein
MAAVSVEVASGEIPKVLARNTACHQCRRRKLVSVTSSDTSHGEPATCRPETRVSFYLPEAVV